MNKHRGASFEDYLVEELKDEKYAIEFIKEAVLTEDFKYLLSVIKQVLKAHKKKESEGV